MAEQGRVSAPELNLRPQLEVAPIVNVQGVAPVNRAGAGSNLINIAESLSGLSGAFQQFANTAKPMQAKQDAYGAGALSGKSYAELHDYFKANPGLLSKEKYAMMYAGKSAANFGTQLQSGELTADWDGKEPMDQFLAKKQQSFVDELPDDPMIRAFFNENANPYTTQYIQGHNKVLAENKITSDVDALTANANNAVAAAKASTNATNSAAGVATRLPIVTGTQAGRQPLNMKGVNGILVDRFEQVQGVFGKQIPIVSGYRDPATNAKAGGAKHSQHMDGNALDLDVSSMDFAERRKLIEIASGMGFTGIGVYHNSIHLDMRKGGPAMWGPSHHKDSIPAWAVMSGAKHMGGGFKQLPHSVAASAVAVDGIFEAVTSQPTYAQLQPNQQNALWFDFASKFEVKSEDDLKIVEGILNHRQANGVPSVSETSDYGEKSRMLLEQKKEEYRKGNTEAQTPIIMAVNEAITTGQGVTAIAELEGKSGNLFSPSYWQEAKVKAQEKQLEVSQKQGAAVAHATKIDEIDLENAKNYTVGQGFSDLNDQEVPDPNSPGKTVTYTAKDQREKARNNILKMIDKTVADNHLPEEARWGMVATYLGKANDTNPAWAAALKATPQSFNPAEAAGGVSPQMEQNAKLYDYLKDSGNYLFLDKHMEGDGTKTFWSMYDSFRGQGQDEKTALFSTYKVMNDKGALAAAHEEVNFAKGAYFKSGISFADSELEGSPLASARVTDMAEALAATGKKGSDALELATKMFKDTHVFAKGAWVPKNMKGLPDNFVDNVTEYVDHYITQYGAKANPPVTDTEDVMIAPDASGTRFYLFQKSTGLPLMAKDAKGGVSRKGVLAVTMDTLRGYDKLKNDRAAIATENTNAAMADAIAQADGTPDAPTKTVGGGRAAPQEVPMTPQEIMDQDKKNAADLNAFKIDKAERLDPNAITIKTEKIKQLRDDEFDQYLSRALEPGKYFHKEEQVIAMELVRRRHLKDPPKDVWNAAKDRWPMLNGSQLIIKLYQNGAWNEDGTYKKDK
ncbi:Peptidase M15A, C-terminal [uncultured Caudovirales phage]|uniref:Peptidase M15A, C-terminal n=1 Tax=uncultured Caudovirales phage TaxID=2100421 RepID=A0A6J7WDP9_9CAUD|nr:Peptidase M15A, C-terminal [uncultured Caudovirales phage]